MVAGQVRHENRFVHPDNPTSVVWGRELQLGERIHEGDVTPSREGGWRTAFPEEVSTLTGKTERWIRLPPKPARQRKQKP